MSASRFRVGYTLGSGVWRFHGFRHRRKQHFKVAYTAGLLSVTPPPWVIVMRDSCPNRIESTSESEDDRASPVARKYRSRSRRVAAEFSLSTICRQCGDSTFALHQKASIKPGQLLSEKQDLTETDTPQTPTITHKEKRNRFPILTGSPPSSTTST
ncbi:hypothetical protein BC936DRAFT_140829 [Jimgerdemannia flammicorona]|uniref:Uncharacterized protein n=1 Tax=Jimgerdemannia flammicorona TaxID=994334 RepID=A0A433DGK4_9FUNG|nr:hypothetical protein BC936DRAFT_140829 [Jimgerdemannia flammicorona]